MWQKILIDLGLYLLKKYVLPEVERRVSDPESSVEEMSFENFKRTAGTVLDERKRGI